MKRLISLFMILLMVGTLWGCTADQTEIARAKSYSISSSSNVVSVALVESGAYGQKDEVAAYLHLYGHLPHNYINKNQAIAFGWKSDEGNLWDVTEHMSIGGDVFSNREGLLPKEKGRTWYECDVNYAGGYRGAERLLYSNDGLIYYTGDHYSTVVLLIGEGDKQ